MNAKKLLIMLAVGFAVAACDDKDEQVVKKDEPGFFKFSQVPAPGSSGGRLASTETSPQPSSTTLDLGRIKLSKMFYFMLANGGDTPITDITLTSSNPAISVSPQSIATLGGSSDPASVVPLVSVGFTHGPRLDALGSGPVLPKGVNSTTLTITGQTVVDGNTVNLSTQVTLSAFAELMDFELYEGPIKRDWNGAYPGLWARTYPDCHLKNSGNVDLMVHYARLESHPDPNQPDNGIIVRTEEDFVLAPGQTWDFTVNVITSGFANSTNRDDHFFTINGGGTISDSNHILLDASGSVLFAVSN